VKRGRQSSLFEPFEQVLGTNACPRHGLQGA
jgi:hypothetical protein